MRLRLSGGGRWSEQEAACPRDEQQAGGFKTAGSESDEAVTLENAKVVGVQDQRPLIFVTRVQKAVGAI